MRGQYIRSHVTLSYVSVIYALTSIKSTFKNILSQLDLTFVFEWEHTLLSLFCQTRVRDSLLQF